MQTIKNVSKISQFYSISSKPKIGTPSEPGRELRLFVLIFIFIILTGCFSRLFQIGGQFVIDDEKHSIQSLLWESPVEIMTHFSLPNKADTCIPQTLFLKALSGLFPLNEINLRILSFIPGILLLIMPLFFSQILGRTALLTYAIILSIHPLLVLHSRFSRPYMMGIFLVCACLFCFYRYCQTNRRQYIIGYSILAAIAVYFHFLTAPTVLTPQILMLTSNLVKGFPLNRKFRWGDMVLSWVILGGIMLLTLGPPLLVDYRSLLAKSARGFIKWETVGKSLTLLTGSGKFLWAIIGLAVLATGMFRLFQKHRLLFMIIALPLVVQVLTVAALRPNGIAEPFVFTRYIIWELPLLLLAVAVGLTDLPVWPGSRKKNAIFGLMILTAWVTVNPIWNIIYVHNNFIIPYAYEKTVYQEKQFIPRFYYQLAKIKGEFSIAEMPWDYHKDLNPWMDYQQIHRKNIYAIVGSASDPRYTTDAWLKDNESKSCVLSDKRLGFRKFISLAEALRHPSIQYIILHRSPLTEYRGHRSIETGSNCRLIRDQILKSGMKQVYRDNLIEAYRPGNRIKSGFPKSE